MYALAGAVFVCVAQTVMIALMWKETSKWKKLAFARYARLGKAIKNAKALAEVNKVLSSKVRSLGQELASSNEEKESLRSEVASLNARNGDLRVQVGILETKLYFPVEVHERMDELKAGAAFDKGQLSVIGKLAKLRLFVVREETTGSRKGGGTYHLKIFSEETPVFSAPLPHPEASSRGSLPFEISINPSDLLGLPHLIGSVGMSS